MRTAATVYLLVASTLIAAAAGRARADEADRIAPFVNNFTLGVVRVEPGGIDFDALDRWGGDVIKQSNMDADAMRIATEGLKQATQEARKWTDQFLKAGGKTVWVVFTVENLPDDPVFVVVPLEHGADGQALQKLLSSGRGDSAQAVAQSKGALITAPDPKSLERVRTIMPQPRPELAKALAEAGDAKVRVALIPSDDARRVIESMIPKLPNGASSESLTKGMLWAAVTITPPANVTLHGVVQSESNTAAEAFRKLLGELAPAAPKVRANDPGASLIQMLAEIASTSKVQGDRVAIDLNEVQTKGAATHLADAVRRARVRASRVRSASNIRQLLLGCQLYSNNHYDKVHKIGQFPDDLAQMMKEQDVMPAALVNPNNPAEKVGYVYIKPPEGAPPSDRVVIYEKYKDWDGGINLGFGDGHVEFWNDQKAAEKAIQEAVAAQKK